MSGSGNGGNTTTATTTYLRRCLSLLAVAAVLSLSLFNLSLNASVTVQVQSHISEARNNIDFLVSALLRDDTADGENPDSAAATGAGTTSFEAAAADAADAAASKTAQSGSRNKKDTGAADHLLLEPVRILEQYKRWHSAEALQKQPDNRAYLVGGFTCPHEAGNRLHVFMSRFLFAIMTNRTLLWNYNGETTYSDSSWEDCFRVLRVRDWIPSYKEWAPKLGFPNPKDTTDKTKVHMPPNLIKFTFRHEPYNGEYRNLSALQSDTVPLVNYKGDFHYVDWRKVEQYLPNQYAIDTMRSLYSEGIFFLYGMLLTNSLDFSPDLKASLPDTFDEGTGEMLAKARQPGDPYTIALHARHIQAGEKGCNVEHELHCIGELLSNRTDAGSNAGNNDKCIVYLASDRTCTLKTLQEEIPQKFPNCEAVVATHSNPKKKDRPKWSEHGPFAGFGFQQDLAYIAARARDAMIVTTENHPTLGKVRSSSALLLELMEYHRRMTHREDAVRRGLGRRSSAKDEETTIPSLDDVPLCYLPHKRTDKLPP